MRPWWTPSSGRWAQATDTGRHRGITLIEAVAGMALLGTLLVAVLMAGARLNRQRGRTALREEATGVADRLLEEWWANRDEFPRSDDGTVTAERPWSWRTRVVENKGAVPLGCEVVALEIFAGDEASAAADKTERAPACRIEVLLTQKAGER